MLDNLDLITQNIDAAIDPNAPIGGILAAEHNELLKKFLASQGRFTGFPYEIGNRTEFGIGKASIKGNTSQIGNEITLEFSKQTVDFVGIDFIYSKLSPGDLVKIKDKNGRVFILEITAKSLETDPLNVDYYKIICALVGANNTYSYTLNDDISAFFEFLLLGVDISQKLEKGSYTGTASDLKADIDTKASTDDLALAANGIKPFSSVGDADTFYTANPPTEDVLWVDTTNENEYTRLASTNTNSDPRPILTPSRAQQTIDDAVTDLEAFVSTEVRGKANVTAGKNLANPAEFENGILGTDGNITPNANFSTTGYIPVIAGQKYTPSYQRFVNFFSDTNQSSFISFVNFQDIPDDFVTVPSGANFARFDLFNGALPDYQVEIGETPTAFEPYENPKLDLNVEANKLTLEAQNELLALTNANLLAVTNALNSSISVLESDIENLTNDEFTLFVDMALHAKSNGFAQAQKVITSVTRNNDNQLTVTPSEISGFDDNDTFFPLVIKTPTKYEVVTASVLDKPNGIIKTYQTLPATISEISTFHVDGQHLSRYGYRSLAEYLADKIERYAYRRNIAFKFYSQNCKPYELQAIDAVTDAVIVDFIRLAGTQVGGLVAPGVPYQAEMGFNESSDQSSTIFKNGFKIYQNVINTGVKAAIPNNVNGYCRIILGEYLPFNVGALKVKVTNQNAVEMYNEVLTGTTQEVLFNVASTDSVLNFEFALNASVLTTWQIASIEIFKSSQINETPILQKNDLTIAFLMDSWGEFPNLIGGESPINRANGTQANGLQFISQHINTYLNALGYDITTYNNSFGGMTSEWARYWLQELVLDLPVKPDYCVFNFNINDANSNSFFISGADSLYDFDPNQPYERLVQSLGGVKGSVSPQRWLDNLKYISQTLVKNGIKPVFLHSPMLDGVSFGILEQTILMLNSDYK